MDQGKEDITFLKTLDYIKLPYIVIFDKNIQVLHFKSFKDEYTKIMEIDEWNYKLISNYDC